MTDKQSPDWYDETKLKRADYAEGYTGWVIDLGDGTCRYANEPLLGADPGEQEDGTVLTEEQCATINSLAPHWGDRVRLTTTDDGFPKADSSVILERYKPPSP